MCSVLIDAGRCAKPVLPVLSQKGELRAIFITHWDDDHIGGIPAVIKWLSNQCQKDISVFINRQFPASNSASRLRKALHEAYKDGTIMLKGAYRDLSSLFEIIGGSFSILWPPHEIGVLYPEDRNRDSLILRFEVGAFSLLCGGDAEGNVWPHVDHAKLKAHVLRYPHHGGELSASKDNWSADDLISKVDPAWIVVSVGADNRYSHPSQEFHDCASRHTGRQFLFTTKGDISLQIDSDSGNIQESTL